MRETIPRFLIAGTGSGCGKTTVTAAVLRALVDRGTDAAGFKCGPDYIDPMFHSRITGTPCASLDPFFFSENTLRLLLAKSGLGRTVSVIEGVMGYYDGLGLGDECSTFSVARATRSPVVLVVNARGTALSALAVLRGFWDFRPDSGIRGVIFNGCSAMLYPRLAAAAAAEFGADVRPLGYLPPLPECSLESRHLGLVTADEVADLEKKLQLLSRQAEQSLDLDGLLELAGAAPEVDYDPLPLPPPGEKVRVAVARDAAFCFYYADSLDLLRLLGAELVPFSPMADRALPEEIDGLYLGGGYPELHTGALRGNRAMLRAVKAAVAEGLPVIAECGGFMYLTEAIGEAPMAGALPGRCFDAGRLTRFGYIRLQAERDNLLCPAGESIPAHEFHHWDCTASGTDFLAEKPGGRAWKAAVGTQTLYAGFPHFHFYANPAFAQRFYEACLKEKHRHGRD